MMNEKSILHYGNVQIELENKLEGVVGRISLWNRGRYNLLAEHPAAQLAQGLRNVRFLHEHIDCAALCGNSKANGLRRPAGDRFWRALEPTLAKWAARVVEEESCKLGKVLPYNECICGYRFGDPNVFDVHSSGSGPEMEGLMTKSAQGLMKAVKKGDRPDFSISVAGLEVHIHEFEHHTFVSCPDLQYRGSLGDLTFHLRNFADLRKSELTPRDLVLSNAAPLSVQSMAALEEIARYRHPDLLTFLGDALERCPQRIGAPSYARSGLYQPAWDVGQLYLFCDHKALNGRARTQWQIDPENGLFVGRGDESFFGRSLSAISREENDACAGAFWGVGLNGDRQDQIFRSLARDSFLMSAPLDIIEARLEARLKETTASEPDIEGSEPTL